nr:LuxR C-terminal-related transcriptional regulator [uncultured Dyadobacter sp.]
MLIGDTDLHIVTFLFIILEIVMLIIQGIFYLQKPEEKSRKYYIILLALLIVKNIAMGLFPDPKITFIPMIAQYILTYGAGFIMASYFPYYFYRSYNIRQLRWHATKGIFLFLHAPFILIFTLEYLIQGDIDQAINYGLYIPAVYGLVLGFVLLRAIRLRYRDDVKNHQYFDMIAVYCAVIPYASLAFCAYFRISQVNEALLTNGGFAIITVLFIRNSIKQSREDSVRLQMLRNSLKKSEIPVIEQELATEHLEENMIYYGLTERQKEIARLVVQDYKYKEIAEMLSRTLKTVEKHIENISKKMDVKTRKELEEALLAKNPIKSHKSA